MEVLLAPSYTFRLSSNFTDIAYLTVYLTNEERDRSIDRSLSVVGNYGENQLLIVV